jgi:hypothetical protein
MNYRPVHERVAEYDKANPGTSTRQAAGDLGISNKSVSVARGVTGVTPDTITGRDGKEYPAKKPRIPDAERVRQKEGVPPPDPMQNADLTDQIVDLFQQLTRTAQVRCAIKLKNTSMTEREYSWRFAKAVSTGLVRNARRNEVLEELLGTGPRAVYAGLLMFEWTKNYKPGWAAHAFREIYGVWPQSQDRKVEPKALPNFLIEEWAAGRKRTPRQQALPLPDGVK